MLDALLEMLGNALFGWRSFVSLLFAAALAYFLAWLWPHWRGEDWVLGLLVFSIYIAGLCWEYRAYWHGERTRP
jgi:hypothetical protein